MRAKKYFLISVIAVQAGLTLHGGDNEKAKIVPIECVKRGNSVLSQVLPYKFNLDSQNYGVSSKLNKDELRAYHKKTVEASVRLQAVRRRSWPMMFVGVSLLGLALGLRYDNMKVTGSSLMSAGFSLMAWADSSFDATYTICCKSAVKQDINKIANAVKMGPSEKGIGLKVELL